MATKKKAHKPDTSPRIHQDRKLKDPVRLREKVWTPKQNHFIQTALDNQSKVMIVDGIWGSGKNLIATYTSLRLLNDKKVSDLIYVRNPVESSTVAKLGYLKGDMASKMEPYAAPLYDKLDELTNQGDKQRLIDDNRVHVLPVGHIRGLSWNCKTIIVDEASCLSYEDLILLISRVGEFCKVFIIGDTFQNDIGAKSGFEDFYKLFDDEESRKHGIYTFKFNEITDIVRSELLQFVMTKIQDSRPQIRKNR